MNLESLTLRPRRTSGLMQTKSCSWTVMTAPNVSQSWNPHVFWRLRALALALLQGRGLSSGDAEFIDQLIKAGAADFQLGGGPGEVSFIARKSGFDHLPLHDFAGLAKTLPLEFRILRNADVFRSDPTVFGHNRRTLNTVFKLADISRPCVSLHGLDGLWSENKPLPL